MTDRTAAEVMCCPDGPCRRQEFLHGICRADAIASFIARLHAAGFMIVPRDPTEEMLAACLDRESSDDDLYSQIYRAMTEAGELK